MEHFNINGINLAYQEVGSGPPLVLVHGYPFNHTLWTNQVIGLSSSYRVITPDLRGFGESDVSDEPATMDRMAEDIAKLLDSLKIQQATLGGLSMGGYVVLAFYRRFPERVRALILADTRSQGDSEEGKKGRAEQAETALKEGMAPIADGMLPKLVTSETVSKRPEVVKRILEMMLKTKPAGAAAALIGMAERADQTEFLSQIAVPTLILVGREDLITPVADSEKLHANIPDSRLVVIDHAGHLSNIEQVEVFNREAMSFLSDLTR